MGTRDARRLRGVRRLARRGQQRRHRPRRGVLLGHLLRTLERRGWQTTASSRHPSSQSMRRG